MKLTTKFGLFVMTGMFPMVANAQGAGLRDLMTDWMQTLGIAGLFLTAVAAIIGVAFLINFGLQLKKLGDDNTRDEVKPLSMVGTFVGALVLLSLSTIMAVGIVTMYGNAANQGNQNFWEVQGN